MFTVCSVYISALVTRADELYLKKNILTLIQREHNNFL